MTQDATEKPAGEISPMSGTGPAPPDGKNEWLSSAANVERDAEPLFEVAARIIRTLAHYKQVGFRKTDIRGQLERFVQALCEKHGLEVFAERLKRYNIIVLRN